MLAANVPHELWRALSFAFGMTWEVLWALILGFGLSALVQAVVSKLSAPECFRVDNADRLERRRRIRKPSPSFGCRV